MAKSCCLIGIVALVALAALDTLPVQTLMTKSASSDSGYSGGWKDGCYSGANAYSPLRALLMEKPFVNRSEEIEKSLADRYRNGWNEGYTSCRFYQDACDRWVMVILVIGAILCKRRRSCKKGVDKEA